MTLLMTQIPLEMGEDLQQQVPELAMRLSREQLNSGKWITLAHPRHDSERRYHRYVGAVALTTAAGGRANGQAQILATSRRILGMVTGGEFGGQPITAKTGPVCFSVNKGELGDLKTEKSRFSGVRRATFTGTAGDPYMLDILLIAARLSNSAHGSKAALVDFLKHLTDAGTADLK